MDFSRLSFYLDHIDNNIMPFYEMRVKKNHEILFEYQHARSDYADEFEKYDRYFLYSATKVFTCTAAMRLVEEGKLNLQDPVSRYLPEFSDMMVKKDGVLCKAENVMTVENLFSMSSGLTYDLNYPSIQEVVRENPHASTRDIVRGIAKMPLQFEPGTDYLYCLGHDVIAAIIEVVTGMSFFDYLKKVILDPLNMKNTCFRDTPEVHSHIHTQFMLDPVTWSSYEMEKANQFILSDRYESGGAGLISTLDDYSVFVDTLASGQSADGYRILKEETIRQMNHNHLSPKGLETYHAQRRFIGQGYGLGVRCMMDPKAANSLSPVGEYGWDGAAGAYCLVDIENKLSVFFGTHVRSNSYQYDYVHLGVRSLVYDALTK